jgi:hypothetical protein
MFYAALPVLRLVFTLFRRASLLVSDAAAVGTPALPTTGLV